MTCLRRSTSFALLILLAAARLWAQGPGAAALESTFDQALNADSIRSWMQVLSAHPHHVGSPYDKQNAEFIAAHFTAWGFDTHIEEFQVLFPTPVTRALEMTAPTAFTASLKEEILSEDATSGQTSEQLPTYNAYSIDGDVTGRLVYVNYGVPADYDELAKTGIDVKGAIVIARYGGSWRGIKPKVAAEHGAIGCIIYSDPRDDGYFQGDDYPKGSFRPPSGAQRGSVADMPIYAGDPLTPFVGATKDAKRLKLTEAKTLTKIPVLPIAYRDALPLLSALGGPVAPDEWKGALPITYHLGPGPATVHMRLAFDWTLKPIYDVIAKIPGTEYPDQWVMRGNHHDAWVNGAGDPLSGQVAMMAEAKGLGALLKTGWKPKRTIIYAAWDGEEPGLLGSTEWVETHAKELTQNGVVYINTDGNGRGFFGAGGSQTLEKFVSGVTRDVTDPQTHVSVAARARARTLAYGSPEERQEARDRSEPRLSSLGSGSDFTPFLQHLGIASLSMGYGGENDGGEYHSIYDSFDHYRRFGDPTFMYGVTLARTGGRMVLRFADAAILPFEFSNFTETVGKFVKEVMQLADNMRDETAATNKLLADNSMVIASDPMKTFIPPAPKDPVPFLNFSPLQNALTQVQQASTSYRDAKARFDSIGKPLAGPALNTLNEILFRAERSLTREKGLPGRPWFTHMIYAPGLYTGYGVKTLPGIREAIEQRKWKEAQEQIVIASGVLESYAREIDKARKALEG